MQTQSFQCSILVPLLLLFWVYVGIFAICVSIDGRAKLPTVKFQQTFWFPGYASVFETSWFMTNSSPFFHLCFVLCQSVHYRRIRVDCCSYVMIKDLLLHYCILWSSMFECKRILRLDAFFSSLLETWCLWQTFALLSYKSSHCSTFITTHCLKFI